MSKMSELHRWALLDKSGKTRMTCAAATKAAAQVNILDQRQEIHGRRISIPKGWTIVKRGPVKDGETVTNLQAGPLTIHKAKVTAAEPTAPRPFQVGDRVRGKMGQDGCTKTGVIIPTEACVVGLPDRVSVLIDGPGSRAFRRYWAYAKNLTLLEPAPHPKAEDDWEGRCITLSVENLKLTDEVATLKAEVERLTAVPPCPEDPNEAAMHRAAVKRSQETGEPFRVALLTLERDSARHGRDSWRQAQLNALGDLDLAQDKLDDIRALVRTWKILHKLDKPPESLSEAVAVVLDGAA